MTLKTRIVSRELHDTKMFCFDKLKERLNEVTQHRGSLPAEVWIENELKAMHEETNRLRATLLALPPVDLDLIRRADRLAEGHCDWATKLPLYCSEIVINQF